MINDDRGQVAMEYILIFAISLILLVVFTLPLAEMSIENTLDVSDSLNAKSELSKLAQAIMKVYGEGQGARQTLHINCPKSLNLNVADSYVSTNMKLKDGSNKLIKVNSKSNLARTSLKLSKGDNVIVVEWPVDGENMEIYKGQ
jgi:uncharacterized protein (UPF0333 family)